MTIDVTSTGVVLTKALRAEVRRRVLLAMSRYSPEVHRVTARLAAPPNPLGGVDQRCRVRARLQSGLVLRAEAMNGLIETAIGRSVAHLMLLVAEALDAAPAGATRRRPRCAFAGRESDPVPQHFGSDAPPSRRRLRAQRNPSPGIGRTR